MAKKLSSKANYLSKWNIKSITTKNGKKTTEIDGKNLFDGVYVKKSVKFKKGGNSDDKYVVNVGNIGNITCETMAEAEKTYKEYVSQSKSGKGRASGEDVILMVDGEPMKEYFGTNKDEYAKGGGMKNKPKNTKRPRPNIRKNPKIVRTQFEEEEFEYGKGGNLASSIKNNIQKIIERANENQDIKGYDIVLSGYSVKVSPDKRDDFWNDLEKIEQKYSVAFSVTDYDDLAIYTSEYEGEMFRTGGVAGSKHVDVAKGYRLPHGYKAVKGEDRNRNYSKGKPKVRVTTGWRLPKGYEVVDGAYNMKYEDGGMMAKGGNVEYAWLVKYEPNDEGKINEEIISNEVMIVEEDSETRKIMKKMKMGETITHNDADINGYAISYTKVPLPKGKKKDTFGGTFGYENGGMMGDNMNDCYCYEIGGL